MEIKNIWAWMIGISLALPFCLAEVKRRAEGAWWYFEQQPIPLIQNMNFTELIIIVVVFYLVYQHVKK